MSYVSVFTLSVLMLLAFIYLYTSNYMAQQTDATIQAEIEGLKERYEIDGLSGLSELIAERISRKPAGSEILLLVDPALNYRVGNLDRWPNVPGTPDGWLNFRLERVAWGDDLVHWARARRFRLPGGFLLLVGRDLHDLEMSKKAVAKTLIWSLAIAAILALLGGIAMTRGLLKRLEMINQTSSEIMQGDLSRRIPTNDTGDDFDQLSSNLNQMLDRIEMLMEGVRRVSDNIAHDLRTPLARLKNHLDEILHNPEPGVRDENIEQAIQEADELLGTFNALLRIARIESQKQPDYFTAVSVGSIVSDAVELYEPLAEEKSQHLTAVVDCEPDTIHGDRELLSQLVVNILDNAIKYTPAGGRISVRVYCLAGRVGLEVADEGAGIPESERDKVFQRFYRLESCRSSPGNGLGLSLVRAIAELHCAVVSLDDNAPGLIFRIKFPVCRPVQGL